MSRAIRKLLEVGRTGVALYVELWRSTLQLLQAPFGPTRPEPS